MVLAAAFALVGQWDTLRNYWDRMASGFGVGRGAAGALSADTEYFCPMDPVVVSMRPGKCDICNMALVRRKVGDAAPLPSGVVARMQFSPYRVQLAGIRTATVDYRPTAREITLPGTVRDDGRVECRVPEHTRSFIAAGQAADVTPGVDEGQPKAPGKVVSLDVDPHGSHANAVIGLDGDGRTFPPGTRVFATVRKTVSELEPFRSLPVGPPPIVQGDVLAVYVCPVHPQVAAVDRGRCPIDRNNNLQRLPLLDNQRVRWWCPTHPKVTADRAGASCDACGGMKLVPRVVTYRPPGKVLTVPESAVVDTGTRAVVFVEQMPGMFDSVEVAIGPRCGDAYPVSSGLEPGQRVAVNGAFLLDAETRLNPSLAAAYFGAAGTARGTSDSTPTAPEPQDVCPVTGKPLGSMGPPVSVTVSGRTVRLCCGACEARLRGSPDKYLPEPKSP